MLESKRGFRDAIIYSRSNKEHTFHLIKNAPRFYVNLGQLILGNIVYQFNASLGYQINELIGVRASIWIRARQLHHLQKKYDS